MPARRSRFRRMRSWVLLAALLAAATLPPAGQAACPPEGTAPSAWGRAFNLLKNRATAPSAARIDRAVTLAAMVAPGRDRRRFSTARGASIEGFVDTVYIGGVESANCEATNPAARDTHIEMSLDAERSRPDQRVIVEVTPRWRRRVLAQGKDWSTRGLAAALIGRRIRVTGWMLFDFDHASESLNTMRPGEHVWRATAWEIHPITDLEVLPTAAR